MPIEFTAMEQSIIKNMMLRKSNRDIATVLDYEVDVIAAFIKDQVEGKEIVTYQMKLDAARPAKKPAPKRVRVPSAASVAKKADERKEKSDLQRKKRIDEYKQNKAAGISNDRRRPPMYKTIEVDYKKLNSVKIDKGTWIYAEPGKEEETKQAYLKKYRRPLDEFTTL